MRIKKVTSLLGVLLVLSVGLMTVKAAEQSDLNQVKQQQQPKAELQKQETAKPQYKPISDVRHVVPPYDEQDQVNTKQPAEVDLESSAAPSNTLALEEQENDTKVETDNTTAVESKENAVSEESVNNEKPAADVKSDTSAVNNEIPAAESPEQKSAPAQNPEEKTIKPVVEETVAPAQPATAVEEIKQTESGYEAIKNKLWCITFQLVWNTFMDKVTHGPVLLAGGNPPIANELNKKLYTSDLLNENSYYTTYGKISKSLKKQIERSIKKKFDETSDILDTINWEAKNSYLFYAMLKKDFNFETPFDKLKSAPFNGSTENVKYFGVNQESDRKLRKNVHVLFYNSPDEYAVRLVTKEKEDVILYRTDKKDSFENLYLYVTQQDVSEKFSKEDSLMVPNFKIDKTISYDELCGKKIKGTNKVITQALQTIKFNMDNKGGTLKSEAAMAIMRMSLAPDIGRKYNFDKDFVLFLKEEGKDKPYFAVRVDNPEFLVKE